ncbi:MAG: nicotinate-nucleotide adenylyltransferase [Bacteroidales bacterium]|jgi:nicotinate-nucleotide adenylyltransferase|nr:nicotinate-nucleotide adenylyltransferase [Bacteroidales bacterium]
MNIGLFFGSFNPIHIGHLVIANYMLAYTEMDQLWFVITPHNPFKKRQALLSESDRLYLVNLSIEGHPEYKASNIEFKMPKPSYTIDTLVRLSEKYPGNRFSIIMGSDNLESFHKWKNSELIIENYHRYIYPRTGTAHLIERAKNVTMVDAPLMDISSTLIRRAIADGKDIPFLLPGKVYQYIKEMHFYEKCLPSPTDEGQK